MWYPVKRDLEINILDILDPFKVKGHQSPPEGRKAPDRDTYQRAGTQNDPKGHHKGTYSGALVLRNCAVSLHAFKVEKLSIITSVIIKKI